jgi:hypothetical protein
MIRRIGLNGFLSFALIISAWSSVTGRNVYKTYANARFGYSIAYPSNLLEPQGESDNSDGQAFRAADGRAEMKVWGQFNVSRESLQSAYLNVVNEFGANVTYKVLRSSWFVVSARIKGKIVYRKTVLRRDVYKTFEIQYDESLGSTYDPVTARVAKSFVG